MPALSTTDAIRDVLVYMIYSVCIYDIFNCVCTAGTEIGAGIYSTVSLFNHSCGPAVVRHMYGQTCVSRAIKTVYAGDEILSI